MKKLNREHEFTYNAVPYVVFKVNNDKVRARRRLKSGKISSAQGKIFSRRMVEKSLGTELPEEAKLVTA